MVSQVNFLLRLTDQNILWQNLNKKTRNQIRKSYRFNLQIKEGIQYLPDFYKLYQKTMKKVGTPPYGIKFFEDILEEFGNRGRIFMSYTAEETPIAGLIILKFEKTLVNLFAGSDRNFNYMQPNNFLYWEVIKWAEENGFEYFDFGRSPRNSGTYHFKKQWGAVEMLFKPYLSPSGRILTPKAAQSRWLSKVWRLIPLPIANWLGPIIRKYVKIISIEH